MTKTIFFRFTAFIIAVISFFMIPALITAIIYGETQMYSAFLIPICAGTLFCAAAFITIRKEKLNLRSKDGYILVLSSWIIAALMGSTCFYLSPNDLSLVDSIFESASCFSTTGVSTILDIESLPKSLLFWRSISQWSGGMGIILLFVALFPLLGVGSFQLVKAEVPGPEKERISPRMTETAKILWAAYCIFTIVLMLLYIIGGMPLFDAICLGLSTITTGGVGVRNLGFAYYNSEFIDWVTTIFMIFASLNFNMYYRIARGKFKEVLVNTELRVFLTIFIIAALCVSISIIPNYGSFGAALRVATFQTASIISTTGTVYADYTLWTPFAQAILVLLMFIGSCSSSTGGGIKVIRLVVLFKQVGNEIRKILYPRGVFSIQINKKVGRKDIVYGVAAFIFLYLTIIGISTLLTTLAGLDLYSSFSISTVLISTAGAGLGAVDPLGGYGAFPDYLKLFYSLLMLAGRLELWAVVVFLSPTFWRN